MTESSGCESDAGASPSVSSDESENNSSSGSSSPILKIACDAPSQSTPIIPKKKATNNTTTTPPPSKGDSICVTPVTSSSRVSASTSSAGNCLTPLTSGRKPVRRRQICTPSTTTPVSSTSKSSLMNTSASSISSAVKTSSSRNTTQNDSVTSIASSAVSSQTRKRKQVSQVISSPDHSDHHGEDAEQISAQKRRRNKRRRTRSERNFRAGKTVTTPGSQTVPVVTEVEEAVALDAEIDRVLEEKAIKNNLSATNVKSIIRHVITNNLVQKMIMSAMKKKAEVADAGGSSDEDGLLEPKMTRAKTKELLGNKQMSLWPIVDSPVKLSKKPVSETHILIHHNDLPEDSSGDEYVPKETDITEITHSDDESSITSHTSDAGSPYKHGFNTRQSVQADKSPFSDSMFKTPPPRQKNLRKTNQVDSAISRRTRSKLPLNDTPLEDLERQLVPPDITKDMYDWGTETDNEDYLCFLKDFLNPVKHQNDANEMDDDADPEYNVMEDDEDLHDREELRMDRAVKVPKKELTQLIAELFEAGGMLSGDDLDEHDLATLTDITPLVNDSGFTDGRVGETSLNSTAALVNASIASATTPVVNSGNVTANPVPDTSIPQGVGTADSRNSQPPETPRTLQSATQEGPTTNFTTQVIVDESTSQVSVIKTNDEVTPTPIIENSQIAAALPTESAETTAENVIEIPYFRDCDLQLLQHQMRQHVQLLTQSFVLTISSEDACLKRIAKSAKTMIVELKNFSRMNGEESNFSVCNLNSAWNIANFWPHKFLQQSPIKKKILEEKYISESGGVNETGQVKGNFFPRHVVKVIVENPAFMYNKLLPECYNQKNLDSRCTFTCAEDCLLVGGLDEMKNLKMSTNQMAEVISQVLLVVHPSNQLFHRIRNLKKTKKSKQTQHCHPSIKAYFSEGILPIPDRTVSEIKDKDKLPLLQRDRAGLSSQWSALVQHIEDSSTSTFKWEEKLRKDPITQSIVKKWNNRQHKRKSIRQQDEVSSSIATPASFSKHSTISSVFPNGALSIDKPQNPNMDSIPIMDINGKVGAIIHVPRLCLVKSISPEKVPRGNSPQEGKKAENHKKFGRRSSSQLLQPREAQEAGIEPYNHQQGQPSAAASNENLIGLHHLIRRSLNTPVKNTAISSKFDKTSGNSSDDQNIRNNHVYNSPFKLPPARAPPSTSKALQSYSVIQVVGKPFDLPELGVSSIVGGTQVIDLSTLQTPMKKKIFEKVAEQELSGNVQKEEPASGEKAKVEDDVDSVPDSPNVIMEGTEVELTSDEEVIDVLYCHETSEMITLSSDEDVDRKPVPVPKDGGGGSNNDGKTTSSSPPKKAESGENKPVPSTSSQSTVINSTSSRKGPARTMGKDDSDEDGDKRPSSNSRKRNLPKDYNGDDDNTGNVAEKEKHSGSQMTKKQTANLSTTTPSVSPQIMQAPPAPGTSSQSQHHQQQSQVPSSSTSSSSSSKQQQKKARRSPGNQGSKSRVSKYNVTPPENMLQEDSNEFEDVADAYMESYLARVQSTTEASHPGIYASFVQILMEAGETAVNQRELHGKVKVLLKEYPELLKEFESFLDPTSETSNEAASSLAGSSSHNQTMAEINFIQMVEKYTVNCPALKAKIMSKLKSLKENPNFSEKELATAMEPFFTGNPVMMEAFKAILPSVYRPQSLSSGMDFEEIELDLEDPPRDSNEDLHYEVVKLPDETQVPATNSCPCVCHTKTSDPAFASRSKHCRKCSLKFQDGKIYIHNGRVMRPVSVELTPAPTINK